MHERKERGCQHKPYPRIVKNRTLKKSSKQEFLMDRCQNRDIYNKGKRKSITRFLKVLSRSTRNNWEKSMIANTYKHREKKNSNEEQELFPA